MITAILNCYKRPEYLQEQIEAIKSQSIPVEDIMVWYNKPEQGTQFNIDNLGVKVVYSNYNFKFHGRFAYGLLSKTKYVAFFDDDTIPGKDWFKNCLEHIDNKSILGTAGVLLQENVYNPHTKVGWNGKLPGVKTEVDLVGHAWFMERNILSYLWNQYPVSWDNGEDIQLSFFSYMNGNVKTFVPPHPLDNTELWGSTKGTSYGNDDKASHKIQTHDSVRDNIVSEFIKLGYKPVVTR
jgi:hypothetical protein